MKRYRSIDYGRVVATADDHLIATPDSPRDAVPIALAQAARDYDGSYVENHCPECGEYAGECSCAERAEVEVCETHQPTSPATAGNHTTPRDHMNEIKKAPGTNGWQTIETAPRGANGYTWMDLAWGPEGDQSSGTGMRWGDRFFAAGVFYCLGQEKRYEIREVEVQPTHWRLSHGVPDDAEESEAADDVAHDALMVLEMLAAEADAGAVMIPSALRLTIDAALIKAGRKAAPEPVRHVTIAGVDR